MYKSTENKSIHEVEYFRPVLKIADAFNIPVDNTAVVCLATLSQGGKRAAVRADRAYPLLLPGVVRRS